MRFLGNAERLILISRKNYYLANRIKLLPVRHYLKLCSTSEGQKMLFVCIRNSCSLWQRINVPEYFIKNTAPIFFFYFSPTLTHMASPQKLKQKKKHKNIKNIKSDPFQPINAQKTWVIWAKTSCAYEKSFHKFRYPSQQSHCLNAGGYCNWQSCNSKAPICLNAMEEGQRLVIWRGGSPWCCEGGRGWRLGGDASDPKSGEYECDRAETEGRDLGQEGGKMVNGVIMLY